MALSASQARPASAVSEVRQKMAAGDWRAAILRAAKFGRLGDQRDRILSAREAYLRPGFQVSIGRDPLRLIRAGIEALLERFGD